LAEDLPGLLGRAGVVAAERLDHSAEHATRLAHAALRLPSLRALSYFAFAAQSGRYSMPSCFISPIFSPHRAFSLSRPRRSVILSHSTAAVSRASFGDLRLARASVSSKESLRMYSLAPGRIGSGTTWRKVFSMASRYSSAPGKALRNFSDRKWERRQGSMMVLGSITIFRL